MENLTVNFFEKIPDQILTCLPNELYRLLQGPALFFLPGKKSGPPLFISTLIHGNEPSGFLALQRLWQEEGFILDRPLLLFLGNIRAAQINERYLADGPDFNRIWGEGPCASLPLVSDVITKIQKYKPIFAVDLHNTSGLNPPYSALSVLRPLELSLAQAFSLIAVHYSEPNTTLSHKLTSFCPSIAVECGKNTDPLSHQKAYQFIKICLKIDQLSLLPNSSLQIYESLMRIYIPPGSSLSFNPAHSANFNFISDLDKFNFKDVPVGTIIGKC